MNPLTVTVVLDQGGGIDCQFPRERIGDAEWLLFSALEWVRRERLWQHFALNQAAAQEWAQLRGQVRGDGRIIEP